MSNVRGERQVCIPYKLPKSCVQLNIVNLIPRAQNLKTGSSYPALSYGPWPIRSKGAEVRNRGYHDIIYPHYSLSVAGVGRRWLQELQASRQILRSCSRKLSVLRQPDFFVSCNNEEMPKSQSSNDRHV